MSDCTERNPVIPQYSKAVPGSNENCGGDAGSGIFLPPPSSGGGIPTIVTGITPIEVDDVSNSLAYKFITKYAPVAQLTVDLTLKDNLDAVFPPISLFGVVYDEIRLSWVYNRAIASQTLTNDGGIVPPPLNPDAVSYIYTGQTIINTLKFTLSGDDGQGLPTSNASDAKSIVFGNYRVWGIGLRRDQGSTSATEMATFIEGLINGSGTRELTTTRIKNPLIGEGDTVDEYFYYAYPASWGFATFYQNNNPGGWKRLANVGGSMVVASLDSLEPGEDNLVINNGTGAESFFVYQTGSGWAAGNIFEVK